MKNKKAQIKIFETIAVLIVFFFILSIGMIFYAREMEKSQLTELEEGFELQALDVIQLTSNLPELQCSSDNIIIENCFDLAKLKSFAQIYQGQNIQYYTNVLGKSRVVLNEIYPGSDTWTLHDQKPLDDKKWNTMHKSQIPISILDNLDDGQYRAAVLTIEVYR